MPSEHPALFPCPWRSTNAQREVTITPVRCAFTRVDAGMSAKCHKAGCVRRAGEDPRPESGQAAAAPTARPAEESAAAVTPAAPPAPETPQDHIVKPDEMVEPVPPPPVRAGACPEAPRRVSKHHLIEANKMVPAEQAAADGPCCQNAQLADARPAFSFRALVAVVTAETLEAIVALAEFEGSDPDSMAAILLNEYVEELLGA